METRSRFHNALARGHVPELIRLRLRPALNERGQPIVVEGDTAAVARMTRSDGAARAIRIPLSPEQGHRWGDHYGAMAASLPPSAQEWLPSGIEVADRGITIGTATYPAVVMSWIEGPTLLRAANRAALRGNSAVLRALTASLRAFSSGLREANVVHGDLAADNLMVRRDGRIAAVDLDTLSWHGAPYRAEGETSPAYRFPGNDASSAQRDAFAVLVQYVSLMLLAESPGVRSSHGDPVEMHGAALLFSAWDLADPGSSRAFREIRATVDPEGKRLLDLLREACEGVPEDVPGILARAVNPPSSSTTWTAPPEESPASTWQTPEREPETSIWDVSRVIERLRREERTTPAASVNVEPLPGVSIPEEIALERQRLRDAIDAGDEANILRQAARLADDPVAQFYKLDVERILAARYRARIADAARQKRDDQVTHLFQEAAERSLPLDAGSRRALRTAVERSEVRDRLERALVANDAEALADLAVSGDLVVLGDTDRATLKRVLQALEWPNLERALAQDDDTLILEAFDEELFDAGAALPHAARDRVMLARDRLAWIVQVRAALKDRDADALERLSRSAPAGGMDRLGRGERTRAELIVRRTKALDQLERAMRAGNDARVLKALHEVEQSGARIDDRMTWMTVRHVVERASLVEKIVEAASAVPVDDRSLAHLLPVARTTGLMADPAFKGDFAWPRLEGLVVRGAALRRIRRALETDDDRAIRLAAFPDVAGALGVLTDDERARVEAAQERRAG
ncbi:MAG TPA: hypothetical protein VNZ55_10220 [Thermomicrobiales bacterium]|nr:hypothetical protein [Thermomicrobiales bacterium]